ncbi:MAG: UDP-3-O-(3-hydroxymyristoyl)glucosamine N-acyltransferase [SAR324 cluster bacterium]|nr:UDP-3-O-(3-hydroxymyristoyl)glucosamine N-acyltransferase [SAR324 cluster bacterium]
MPKIAELANQVGLPFEGDGDMEVRRIRGLDTAREGDLAFLRSPQHAQVALDSEARALVAPEKVELPGKTVIRSPFPQLTIAQLTPILHPRPKPPQGIDPRAVVGRNCSIDPSAAIHPLVSIGDGVTIGARSQLHPGVCVGEGAVIGEDCLIHPNVTVGWGCRIGNRVIIHSGSVIGSDGFGYFMHEGRHVKIPHVGIVVLEDDVEVGGGNSIDRGTYGETVFREGVKTDNLVHIAHNVEVGEHTLLAGQVGIAGSSKIGDHVIMSGQSGVLDHMSITPGVTVGPKSVMTRAGKQGEVYYGFPARPHRDWQRAVAHLNGLDKLIKRFNKLLGGRAGEQEQ